MDIQSAYDIWADQYDTNHNKTRDLEALALQTSLAGLPLGHCLEMGCGTGKNTTWLLEKAVTVTAVDFSGQMLARAREKINSAQVKFLQADITQTWLFGSAMFDLVSFSLVLEHIENLDFVFEQTARVLRPGAYVYLGELHPYKQYTGTKARFDTAQGRQVLTCYLHHISDFLQAARKHGLLLLNLGEHFDVPDETRVPRILTLLFQKPAS